MIDTVSWPLALALAVHLLALCSLWGCLLFLRLPGQVAAESLEPWCSIMCGAALLVAALGQGLWLCAAAAQISGSDDAFSFDTDLLRTFVAGSQFGQLWLVRSGLLLVTVALWWQRPSGRSLDRELLPWAGALLISLAASGHGGAADGVRRLLLPVLAVHLAAVGAWIGSLPPLAHLAGKGASAALSEAVRRYRSFGQTAVLAAALSGIAAVGLLCRGQALSWQADWTRLLGIKFALVLTMAGLGAVNRFLLADGNPSRLRMVVTLEYAVAALVVTAAALLSQTSPPV
ncbi:MAG TPA: CopD family protein [Candidatus Sulfotelmatobacter sp.]|jgi:putative copper export protein|nr:CopD family protein [Candidatus Sulfotelmatobacter sp.]